MSAPQRFRKKPVEIEAMQLWRGNAYEVAEWCGQRVTGHFGPDEEARLVLLHTSARGHDRAQRKPTAMGDRMIRCHHCTHPLDGPDGPIITNGNLE